MTTASTADVTLTSAGRTLVLPRTSWERCLQRAAASGWEVAGSFAPAPSLPRGIELSGDIIVWSPLLDPLREGFGARPEPPVPAMGRLTHLPASNARALASAAGRWPAALPQPPALPELLTFLAAAGEGGITISAND